MREIQRKFLSALLDDSESQTAKTDGNWFLIPDRTLRISEKYRNSAHPCFVQTENLLSPYGIVRVFVRSTSTSQASPPEFLHHTAHPRHHSCSLKLDGVVSVGRSIRVGALNFQGITPQCDEKDEEWRKYLCACIKRVS